jgi:hypothetical protein
MKDFFGKEAFEERKKISGDRCWLLWLKIKAVISFTFY